MAAEIIHLQAIQGIRTPIGHSIRTGETAYKQLEYLHAEGRKRIDTLARTFETLIELNRPDPRPLHRRSAQAFLERKGMR